MLPSEPRRPQSRPIAPLSGCGADAARIRSMPPLQSCRACANAAGRARRAYRQAYDDMAAIPGEFRARAPRSHGHPSAARPWAEFPIDPVLTPSATRALQDLNDLPTLFRVEPGPVRTFDSSTKCASASSAYRKAAGLNATDRATMDKILSEFDSHGQAALEAGLFGPRQAARRPTTSRLHACHGRLRRAVPVSAVGRGGWARASPESLVQWLAKQGGIRMNGDTRPRTCTG